MIDRSNNGAFRNARFQLKDPALANPAGKWNLSESNLKGSRELAGYKVLFVLLSNWDVKPENSVDRKCRRRPGICLDGLGGLHGPVGRTDGAQQMGL